MGLFRKSSDLTKNMSRTSTDIKEDVINYKNSWIHFTCIKYLQGIYSYIGCMAPLFPKEALTL
jgi:hypothetical protein